MNHKVKLGALLGGLALIASCQSAAPENVNAASLLPELQVFPGNTGTAELTRDWWTQFQDQQLNALIEEALAGSPSLGAAGARVRVAAANLVARGGAMDPQVTAGLNLARHRQVFIGLPIPGADIASNTSTSNGLSVNASWELDLWGRLEAAESAAALGVSKSLVDEQAARLALTTSVARSYFALLEAQLALEIARDQVRNAGASLEATERLESLGRGSIEAVLAARIAHRTAMNGVTEASQSVAVLQPSLAALIGRADGRLPIQAKPFASLPDSPEAGLPATLLRRRPDLASLELDVQIAFAGAEAAHAALYPQISLTASAGTNSSDLEDLVNGDFRVWSLGANLLAPLLNGGQLEAAKQGAVATRDAALFDFASGALHAFAEVQVAMTNEALIERRIAEVKLLAFQLTELEETATRHHRQGTGPSALVYSTRADQLRNDRTELALMALARLARIDLIASLGGGFEVVPNQTIDSSFDTEGETSR